MQMRVLFSSEVATKCGVLSVGDERRTLARAKARRQQSAAKAAHSKKGVPSDDRTLPVRCVTSSEESGIYRNASGTVPISFGNARGCVESRERPNKGDVGLGGAFFGVRHLGAAFVPAGSYAFSVCPGLGVLENVQKADDPTVANNRPVVILEERAQASDEESLFS